MLKILILCDPILNLWINLTSLLKSFRGKSSPEQNTDKNRSENVILHHYGLINLIGGQFGKLVRSFWAAF